MELYFNQSLGLNYKSNSQKMRVLTESWAEANLYCPCCGNQKLIHLKNNQPVADFYCASCNEIFEFKSKRGHLGRKINDGAYKTAILRITSNTNPNLLVLQYQNNHVENLEFIPKYFFTSKIIEARKPLAKTAKRAGWQGCNILFGKIPKQGRINIIASETIISKDIIEKKYQDTLKLNVNNLKERGWLLDVLNCINSLDKDVFSLKDMYHFEGKLKNLHLNNKNIRPKIRQQLQYLRNKGYINFLDKGLYLKCIK